jgi:hypothetical protein
LYFFIEACIKNNQLIVLLIEFGKWDRPTSANPWSKKKIYKQVGWIVTTLPFLTALFFDMVSRLSPKEVMFVLEVIVIAEVDWSPRLTNGPISHSSSLLGQMDVPLAGFTLSEPCLFFLGKTLFSRCKVALTSLPAAQVHAFRKLFLKLSLKNAYKIGFIAELE